MHFLVILWCVDGFTNVTEHVLTLELLLNKTPLFVTECIIYVL